MERKKRNNATVTFSRKEQKEQLLQYLNSAQLQNIMPDGVKGKDCQMVLWAVEYLHRLAVDGKLRVQVPMFEEESAEKHGMLDEIARLTAKEREAVATINMLLQERNSQAERKESLIVQLTSILDHAGKAYRETGHLPGIRVSGQPGHGELAIVVDSLRVVLDELTENEREN